MASFLKKLGYLRNKEVFSKTLCFYFPLYEKSSIGIVIIDLRYWPHAMSHSQANFERALLLPPASTRIIKCECMVAIVLAVLVVMRALASPATILSVASTYGNDVKIIASFNFHVIPGIILRDKHVGTFGSGILGNIVVLLDNGEWRCKYVSLFS